MIGVIASADTHAKISELNVGKTLDIQFLSGSTRQIVQTIESEQIFTHIVVDLEGLAEGTIDDAIDALERLKRTAPRAVIIVIDSQHTSEELSVQNIRDVGVQHILHSSGTQLKMELGRLFHAEKLYADQQEEEPTPLPQQQEPEPEPVQQAEPEPPSNAIPFEPVVSEPPPRKRIEQTIKPASQTPRAEARSRIERQSPRSNLQTALTIGVAGAGRRIGTTTQAMQLALYLQSHGEEVAVMQMNSIYDEVMRYNSNLDQYITQFPAEAVELIDSEHFRINDIDIYRSGKSIAAAKRDFRYLVCDYGDYSALHDTSAFLEKDVKVIVGGVKPWEVELMNAAANADDGSFYYIFSFVLPLDRKVVRERMAESGDKTFFATDAPDFFSYCGNDEIYSNIVTIKRKPNEKPERERSGFLGLFGGKKHGIV